VVVWYGFGGAVMVGMIFILFYTPSSFSNLHAWELCATGADSVGCQGNAIIVVILCLNICGKKD
jgi:hypothetical protein